MSSRLKKLEEAADTAVMAFGQVMNMAPICLIRGPDKRRIAYYRESDDVIFMLRERGGGAGRAVHAINTERTTLERYFLRGEITQSQFEAGQAMQLIFDRGGTLRHASLRYDGVRGSGSRFEFTAAQLSAMISIRDILESMSRVSREFLRRCVCYGEWAAKVAEDHKLPRRYGIVRLREGLDDLHDYFEKTRRRERRRVPHTMPYPAQPSQAGPLHATPALPGLTEPVRTRPGLSGPASAEPSYATAVGNV